MRTLTLAAALGLAAPHADTPSRARTPSAAGAEIAGLRGVGDPELDGIMAALVEDSVDWPSARAQAAQILTPVLDRSDEGQVLAERLLDLTAQDDSAVPRGFLNEFVRYQFGHAIGEWLGLARDFESARIIRRGWPRYVAGAVGQVPGRADFDRLTPALTAAFLDRAGTDRGAALRIPDGSRARGADWRL